MRLESSDEGEAAWPYVSSPSEVVCPVNAPTTVSLGSAAVMGVTSAEALLSEAADAAVGTVECAPNAKMSTAAKPYANTHGDSENMDAADSE